MPFQAPCPAAQTPPEGTLAVEEYLSKVVGLTATQLGKVKSFWSTSGGRRLPPVRKCAQVMDYLLSDEVSLTREDLGKVIGDCPQILDVFSAETLREKLRFLREEARVPDADLADVLSRFPQVVGRSVTGTLRPALEFWVGTMGVPRDEMGSVLKRKPEQVWCKPQTMHPKWRFAEDVMGLSFRDVLECETPFFRLSLDKTIAPRHFFLRRQNITGLSLDDTLGGSDVAFSERVRCKPTAYACWLRDEWPASEEARTVAWIKPRPAARHGGRRPWPGGVRREH